MDNFKKFEKLNSVASYLFESLCDEYHDAELKRWYSRGLDVIEQIIWEERQADEKQIRHQLATDQDRLRRALGVSAV